MTNVSSPETPAPKPAASLVFGVVLALLLLGGGVVLLLIQRSRAA